MRGGTSKGVFVRESALPAPGPQRDRLLLDLMGSPDPMQLDGLGGTHSSTSKVMAVSPAAELDVDVDYLFAQVAVDDAVVDYSGNCGNLSAAVGAYALDEGLVEASGPGAEVRMRNRNTGARIDAAVVGPADARPSGDGMPRSGTRLLTRYHEPSGAVLGSMLPLGAPTVSLATPSGDLEASLVDVAHPVVFISAADVGLRGDEPPAALNADPPLLALLEDVRSGIARTLADRARRAGAPAPPSGPTVPRLALVSAARTEPAALRLTSLSMGRVHHALPITVALCAAAAAVSAGTLPHAIAGLEPGGGELTVGLEHPGGVVEVTVELDGSPNAPAVRSVAVQRTARRLMEGVARLPEVVR